MFCKIVKGEIPSVRFYEDDDFLAVFDIRPANPGHLILFPKKHYTFLNEMSDAEVGRMFALARNLASIMVKTVKAQGYNLVHSAGSVAGQLTPHVMVHIIPRFKGDKVNISWEPVKMNEQDFIRIRSV